MKIRKSQTSGTYRKPVIQGPFYRGTTEHGRDPVPNADELRARSFESARRTVTLVSYLGRAYMVYGGRTFALVDAPEQAAALASRLPVSVAAPPKAPPTSRERTIDTIDKALEDYADSALIETPGDDSGDFDMEVPAFLRSKDAVTGQLGEADSTPHERKQVVPVEVADFDVPRQREIVEGRD